MQITDDMLRAAIEAMKPDRIQGFIYGKDHVIRDVSKPTDQQEIFRRPVAECYGVEWDERCEMERLRVGITAALKAE